MRLDGEAKCCIGHPSANKATPAVRAKMKGKETLKFDDLMEAKKLKPPEGGVPSYGQDTRTPRIRAVFPNKPRIGWRSKWSNRENAKSKACLEEAFEFIEEAQLPTM